MILERERVGRPIKRDRKIELSHPLRKMGEKPAWTLQHGALWGNVRGFCTGFHSEWHESYCSILRPELCYQKEYVDTARVFDKKPIY